MALKLSHCPLGFKVTILKSGLACGLPDASRMDPRGWGAAASSPCSLPSRTAYSQRPFFFFFFNLCHVCKVYGGFSFEKQKNPQVLFGIFFSPSTMKDSFSQKYKGKENPLKDVVDLSI